MRNWFVALVVAFVAVALGSPATAEENSPFGVVSAAGLGNDVCRQDGLASLGTGFVRAPWAWYEVEVRQDQFEWQQPDALVNAMDARDIWIYWDFSYAPCWANGRPCQSGPFGPGTKTSEADSHYPPLNQSDLADYVNEVVTRYQGRKIYWGLWNEADSTAFYRGGGTGTTNINRYKANELLTIVNAIRAADPAAKIVVGDLSTRIQNTLNRGELRQVLDAVAGKFDAISLHIYGAGNSCNGRLNSTSSSSQGLDPIRNSLVSWGYADVPVWVTEVGGGINDFGSIAGQNSFLTCFWKGLQTRPWWKKSFWYRYEAEPNGTGLLDGGPGVCMYTTNSTYTTYQDVISGWPAFPATPPGLMATAGNQQVALSWTAASGATSYSVKRTNVSGTPFKVIATGVAGASYTNTGLINGLTYHYVVSAQNAAGESLESNVASAQPVQPPNGGPNPSFELGTAGDATSWTEGVNHARSSDRAKDGAWSLKSTYAGGGTATFQTLSVTPGTAYTFSAWIYKASTTGNAYVDMNDVPGEAQLLATVTNQWQLRTGTWNSGSSTSATLRAVTDGNPNGSIWFDSITLVPAQQVVPNSSFETGAGTDASSWTEGAPTHTRASDRARTGMWSLKSTYTGPGVATHTAPLAVSPGATYTFSGWIYKSATTGNASIDMNDIPGELQLIATQASQWQFVSGTWNSGSNSSVILRCVTDGSPNGSIWFDDIRLVRK